MKDLMGLPELFYLNFRVVGGSVSDLNPNTEYPILHLLQQQFSFPTKKKYKKNGPANATETTMVVKWSAKQTNCLFSLATAMTLMNTSGQVITGHCAPRQNPHLISVACLLRQKISCQCQSDKDNEKILFC